MNTRQRYLTGFRPGARLIAPAAILILGATLCCASQAADPVQPDAAVKRPKIGLVLAGGGAKGAAHVGVLKVLEEMHIPVDYVAGTSMGSIVGGLYASGLSPQEIEREINQIDWQDVFIDDPKREDRSFRRKQDDTLYAFKAKPGFKDGEIKLPLAYVQGQKFDLQLSRLTQRVAGVRDFDRLPIPFRAVAADLETGEAVVLKSGKLARALRASMAVPGAFDPVELGGKLLVDGGIANNIPINVAREMGADIVIVSELGTEMLTRDQITSAISVAGQMVNFLFVINSREQLKTLRPEDVRISCKLNAIDAGSFDRIREAMPIGEVAAREAAASLQRYAIGAEAFAQHLAARSHPDTTAPRIDFVRVENASDVDDQVIARHISARTGEPLDVAQLEKDIQQIYGLEIFESVRYDIVEESGKTGLIVSAKEKPWGPGYLQTGLITSSNFAGDQAFRFGLVYTHQPINALNGEWRVALQLGDEPGISTEIFQPLDPAARWFGFGRLGYASRNTNLFDDAGNQVAEVRVKSTSLELAGGRQFGTWGEARLGYQRVTGNMDVSVGAPLPDRDFERGEAYLRLTSDKLDSLFFPTKGHYALAEYRISREGLGADSDFEQANLELGNAGTWGRNVLIGRLSLHTTPNDDAPVQNLYRLGGFLKLSGYEQDQLSGQHSALASMTYMRKINDFPMFQGYFGASLEYGNVWQDASDISLGSGLFAGSVFVGADTPVGPIYLGYGRNEENDQSLYLFLGPLFSF